MRYDQIAWEMLNSIQDQRWKHVAVLVRNRKPLSIATNDLSRTHPLSGPNRKTHAEIRCLRKAPDNKIEGSDLYVWRLKQGRFSLSKPCVDCENYIREVGIKRVYYSTDRGFSVMRL